MATCFLGCVRIRSGAMPSSQEAPARMAECRVVRCAIYARKSTEEGLTQPFNSLDAQRESAEAYISSQRDKGWTVLERRYEDGGYTGANLDRPALRALLEDIEAGQVGGYGSIRKRYPTPCSVTMRRGRPGLASSFWRPCYPALSPPAVALPAPFERTTYPQILPTRHFF